MEKIKVCHIITKLELGGAQQVALYIVSNLDKEKFIPILITGKGGLLDEEAAKLKGIKVFFTSTIIRQIRPCKDIFGFLKILRILIKERPQVVHTHSSKAGILGRWAAYFAGVPIIVHTIHGFGFNEFQKSFIKTLLIWAEKITARITDKLIIVTREDKLKGLKYKIGTEEKYILIRAGIDTNLHKNLQISKEKKKEELGILSEQKVITTIGSFKPQKNLKDFIKTARNVSESLRNCVFLIVGDGEQRKDLEFQIFASGLKDKVKLLGWRNDIPELLAVTDVFALTSLWEGLPRTIIEAMCLKLPVVAYAVDGAKELVKDGETGYLIKPFDTQKMAERIIELLKQENTAKSFGQRAYENITQEFDIKYMLRQQEDLYAKLIKDKALKS